MNANYPRVAERAGHRCEYCHAPEVVFNFPFEVEHVVPSCHGGGGEESNLALACRSCNLFKAGFVTGVDPETAAEAALFDPRRHSWDAHFTVGRETGTIEGTSPTGRSTVARLRFNSPLQLAARLVWMRLRLFP